MHLTTREMVLAALFTAIMCVLTIVVRSVQPVLIIPFSLQPVVVLVASAFLSPGAAALSMLAYLLLGLAGIFQTSLWGSCLLFNSQLWFTAEFSLDGLSTGKNY